MWCEEWKYAKYIDTTNGLTEHFFVPTILKLWHIFVCLEAIKVSNRKENKQVAQHEWWLTRVDNFHSSLVLNFLSSMA